MCSGATQRPCNSCNTGYRKAMSSPKHQTAIVTVARIPCFRVMIPRRARFTQNATSQTHSIFSFDHFPSSKGARLLVPLQNLKPLQNSSSSAASLSMCAHRCLLGVISPHPDLCRMVTPISPGSQRCQFL